MTIISCTECANPWGMILARGEEPTDGWQQLCQAMMLESWLELAEIDDVPEDAEFDLDKLPQVKPVRVIYLTAALAKFCDEQLGIIPEFLDDCWQELAWVDMPNWLFKGRKQRWAYRWDCCNLGWASNYLKDSVEKVSG